MTYDLIYPMFAMVTLTLMIGFLNLKTRFQAARAGRLDPKYFKTYSVGTPPDDVLKVGRHFNNLFEVPTLFYAGCLAGMIVGVAGVAPLVCAWGFVAARIAHAYIHIGSNKLYPRMTSFFVGFGFVFALWIVVLIRALAIRA